MDNKTNEILERLSLIENQLKKNHFTQIKNNFVNNLQIICITLSLVFLVRISFLLGWSTPYRQFILLASLYISFLIYSFMTSRKNHQFVQLMNIPLFHLLIYAAVFRFHVLIPDYGLAILTFLNFSSLWLYQYFKNSSYIGISIIGVYTSAYFFNQSFESLLNLVPYLFFWNIVFIQYAIKLKNRTLLYVTAYFSLGIIGLLSGKTNFSDHTMIQLISVQCLQAVIYFIGLIFITKENITRKEIWKLFPLFLFFYAQILFFLNILSPTHTYIVPLTLLVPTFFIFKTLKNKEVYTGFTVTWVSFLLTHAIFILGTFDLLKFSFFFLEGIALLFFYYKTKSLETFKELHINFSIIFLYSYIVMLMGNSEYPRILFISSGIFLLLIMGIGSYFVRNQQLKV